MPGQAPTASPPTALHALVPSPPVPGRGGRRQPVRPPDDVEGQSTAGRRTVARAMWIGMWVWPTFVLLDLYMCLVAYPQAPIGLFLVYRVVLETVFVLVYRASKRGSMDIKRLFWLQNLTYSFAALAIALMAVHLGGIRSPYMHGISIVALVRAAVVPTHWKQGLNTYLRVAIAFPLVMGLGVMISPEARQDWLSSASLIVFASNYVFVISSCFLGLVSGHMVWSAQEQLYRARRVGRYRLQAPIGKGGMGEVWLAWDQTLRRNVALKILRVGTDTAADSVRRFELEAQAAGQLHGPHIVQIFDFGASEDGLYYIAMEYLNGMSLATLVDTFGALPTARAIDIGMQACLALEEAHTAGIIHRDLKPHNLYLIRTPEAPDFVKLLDFGIARLRDKTMRPDRLTMTGLMVGTPAYLAPEVWLGDEADERSDIYALGVTLHVLLTGVTPFEGWSMADLQSAHFAAEPPALSISSSDPLKEKLETLLLRCMAWSADNRVQTVSELRAELAMLYDPSAWTAEDAEKFWQAVDRQRAAH